MRNVKAAEVCLGSRELAADHAFFVEQLGFRMESIFPADDPAVVVLVGHGVRVRLEAVRGGEREAVAGRLRLRCQDPDTLARAIAEGGGDERQLRSPGGTRIELVKEELTVTVPGAKRELIVRRMSDDAPWGVGRAGMLYRDLIPGRLGGAVIASHIRIPDAGPVPDLVHYHAIRFQLIFCCKGWVRLVYEDQGPPFVLHAGDCVIQPPQIRHRVLEASAGLEVIEVGLPAEHLTIADHELELPTAAVRPERGFGGQRFCRSEAKDAAWGGWRLPGWEARETGIGEATGGVAEVRVVRPGSGPGARAEGGAMARHTADVWFGFVLAGEVTFCAEGRGDVRLAAGDAITVPPRLATALVEPSDTLELLEVALPASFATARSGQGGPRRAARSAQAVRRPDDR